MQLLICVVKSFVQLTPKQQLQTSHADSLLIRMKKTSHGAVNTKLFSFREHDCKCHYNCAYANSTVHARWAVAFLCLGDQLVPAHGNHDATDKH